jgi:hypothetical protein
MRVAWRSLLVCVLGVVLAGSSFATCVQAVEPSGGEASSEISLLDSPLVVPSENEMLGGAQQQSAQEASYDNPEAVAARQASASAYESLSAESAEKIVNEAFGDLVNDPAGGLSSLGTGEQVISYLTDSAARVELPTGQPAILESSTPLAIEAPGGGYAPIDLSLREAGRGFEPAVSPTGVRIPAKLDGGTALSDRGVSLTPVDEHGSALRGSRGVVDGATVFYGDSEDSQAGVYDLGAQVKPSPDGFDLTTLLFSQRSPDKLYFLVRTPDGARLENEPDGAIHVVRDGGTLAVVRAPSAVDAEGSDVPASMSVQGDTIMLAIDHASGSYLYPIAVDPEVNDGQLATTSGGKRSNWEFHTSNGTRFVGNPAYEGVEKEHLETKGTAEYSGTDWAYWGYETKGNSKIYELKGETEAKNVSGGKIESFVELQEPGGVKEEKELLSTEANLTYARKPLPEPLCPKGITTCGPTFGHEKNAVHFQQSATGPSGSKYNFSDTLYQGIVSISEPSGTHATTSFNTCSMAPAAG